MGADYVSTLTQQGTFGVFGNTGPRPVALVVDAKRNVYTANSEGKSVSKITATGVDSIVGTIEGVPSSLGLDQSGNLLLADSQGNKVWKFAGVANDSGGGDSGTPQTVVGNGVLASSSSLPVSGSKKLMKSGCKTSAGKRVGVRNPFRQDADC